jgi:hypothetical protein
MPQGISLHSQLKSDQKPTFPSHSIVPATYGLKKSRSDLREVGKQSALRTFSAKGKIVFAKGETLAFLFREELSIQSCEWVV